MTSIGLATVWTQLVRQKRQTSPEIALSRETAGNAGNAGNNSVNSHGKKQLPETLRNIYAERGNSPLHYQCSLQAEEQKIQQAKLGSGSMPLDDASGDADGLPADPQPAVPLSLSYVRGMNE